MSEATVLGTPTRPIPSDGAEPLLEMKRSRISLRQSGGSNRFPIPIVN